MSSFFAAMLERGTEQRSAAQFASEVEGIAGSVEGFSGRNSFGLTGDFLADSLDTGLELFADALLHPAFDPEEIEEFFRFLAVDPFWSVEPPGIPWIGQLGVALDRRRVRLCRPCSRQEEWQRQQEQAGSLG